MEAGPNTNTFTENDWIEPCKRFLTQLSELESEKDLLARRQTAIEFICREFDAEFGFWSWGQGHPEGERVVLPVAMVPWGMEDAERVAFFQLGMTDAADHWFRFPFLPFLEKWPQACKACSHFWTPEEWAASPLRNQLVEQTHLDQWMTCIRYASPQIWSCVSLFRRTGKPSFNDMQCTLLDIACAGIRWLQSETTNLREDTSIVGLSPRNTEVLYLLLDGHSRKEMAQLLGLTMHIVNDCIKQIYSHFGTSSATELAALFLRRA